MGELGETPQIDKITKLLNENPGLKIVRGEFGEITFTRRDPQKLDDIFQSILATLTREPTSKKIGMTVRVLSGPNHPERRTQIDIFPKDDKKGYFVTKGSKIDPENIFKIIRNGIEIFNAYRDCPPERRNLFLLKDPSDPHVGESVFEDILRQDSDYLDWNSNNEPNPKEVVEKIASRKTARHIGLSSVMDDPLPSEHILVMNRLLSLSLSSRPRTK